MQVPTGRQNRRRSYEVAADDWSDETSIERAYERRNLVVFGEQLVDARQFVESLRASGICAAGNAASAASVDSAAMIARTAAPASLRPNALSAIADNVPARSSAPGVSPSTCRPWGMSVYSSSRIAAPSLSIFLARSAPVRLGLNEVDGGSLRLDEFGKQAALMVGLGFTGAVA